MIIDLFSDPQTSYVRNCILKCKPEDINMSSFGGGMFTAQDGIVFARLDGYAIIPAEEYMQMKECLKERGIQT